MVLADAESTVYAPVVAHAMKLSKTNYLIYRDCPHNAWLKAHKPEVYRAKPLSVFDQAIIDMGNDVDELARKLFPGGILIERGDAGRTALLVTQRTPVLYQPVFETDRYTTACDILFWNEAARVFDLYEVKGSNSGEDKKAKDELYTHDIAFQKIVLEENGVALGRLYLVRLNREYVRGEALDLQQLFTREDFTERVGGIIEAVRVEMGAAYNVMQEEKELRAPCNCIYRGRSAQCTTFDYTNHHVPAYSVHDISRIGNSKKKLAELVDRGILAIEDVPGECALSETQRNQVRAAQSKQAFIDGAAVASFLEAFHYPIAFLDYESYPAAIPRFAGYRPFQQIPFQFSLDVIDAPGGQPRHHEFLCTEPGNPDRELVAALKAALPPTGSVVVWSKKFENGINEDLAERLPSERALLEDVTARVIDLMEIFVDQAFIHPEFKGKTSIKNVLPALVPALSYKGLAIQEGGTATETWNKIVTGKVDAQMAAKMRADLLEYCALDTHAMVEIWWVLCRSVGAMAETV